MKQSYYLFRFLLFSCFFINVFLSLGQQSDEQTVILLGNTAQVAPDAQILTQIKTTVLAAKGKVTLLILGDILDNNGLGKKYDGKDSLRMIALANMVKGNPNAEIFFIPGDRDWHNSGKKGLKRVRNLEKLIEKGLGFDKAFLPSKGCPGPKVIELGEDLLLIAVNTQWWMHPHDKPSPSDADCKIATRDDFYEELEGIIDESEQKNILIAGHHPVYSSGQYAGKGLIGKHIFPLTVINPNLFLPLAHSGFILYGLSPKYRNSQGHGT